MVRSPILISPTHLLEPGNALHADVLVGLQVVHGQGRLLPVGFVLCLPLGKLLFHFHANAHQALFAVQLCFLQGHLKGEQLAVSTLLINFEVT